MKKYLFSNSRMAAVIIVIAIILSSIARLTPSFAKAGPAKSHVSPAQEAALKAFEEEKHHLINRLTTDHLIDAGKGFTVEKMGRILIIDGKTQPPAISYKYLSGFKQASILIEVYPFREWLRRHPEQIRAPFIYPATMVDYHAWKPGGGC